MNINANSPSSVDRLSASEPIAADSAKTTTTSSGTTQTFLQLLVAQLKNQDPMNPADGMQFVTELAQFSQLEQTIAIRKDLDILTGAPSA